MQRIIILSICLCCALGAFAQSSSGDTSEISYTIPVKYEIGGLRVIGDHYDKNIITSLSGLSLGQKITIPGDDITQAIQALWKQNLFSDVKYFRMRYKEPKSF